MVSLEGRAPLGYSPSCHCVDSAGSAGSAHSEGSFEDDHGGGQAFGHTASKVTAAKSTFEQYYANLKNETEARGHRYYRRVRLQVPCPVNSVVLVIAEGKCWKRECLRKG